MQKLILKFVILLVTMLVPLEVIATETYNLDPSHSYVQFSINHFGFSNPSGKWMVESGVLNFDQTKSQYSTVNVNISTSEVVTGIPKLDEHLKSKDFFDTVNYPKATFVSTKVLVNSKNNGKVYGLLTLHGITKPVTLDVTFNKAALSPITHLKTIGFSANTQIKRSDFGIKMYTPGLGDKVDLHIEVEAIAQK